MKNCIILFAALFVQCHVFAQDSRKEPFITKTITESFTAAKVRTSGGNITVSGMGAGEVKVEVYVQANNNRQNLSDAELKSRLEELYDVEIGVRDNTLHAIAKPKQKMRDWKRALGISFKIFVPEKTSTDLSTSGGNIDISNMTGTQDFTTSGGNLQLAGITGKIQGRTSGGNIQLKDCKEQIDLRTSGGNIEAKRCEGKLELHTSGGSIFLKDLKGDVRSTTSGGSVEGKTITGDLVAHTSGGSIRFDELSGNLETSTSGGSIHVSMKELGQYVRISNSSGNVDLDLPKGKGLDLDLAGGRVSTDRLDNFSGKLKDDEISGTVNGGGVLVRVKAGSGRINLGLK